jgi:hypothetical protein
MSGLVVNSIFRSGQTIEQWNGFLTALSKKHLRFFSLVAGIDVTPGECHIILMDYIRMDP